MAIKAGQILHVADGFLVDRIQSAGAGSVNVNTERIEELGNYQAVATIRDIPDLSFEMETFDMGTEMHEILFNAASGDAAGTKYDVEIDVKPMDIISPSTKRSPTLVLITSMPNSRMAISKPILVMTVTQTAGGSSSPFSRLYFAQIAMM